MAAQKNIILFIAIILLTPEICLGEIIKIPISPQIKSFMDDRHYNPDEIDSLKLEPNTNGEKTYYIDGNKGNDAWDGLYPDHIPNTNHGPYKTISRASGRYDGHKTGERVLIRTGYYREGFGAGNMTGPLDENHYNTWGPYGDGEVVLDVSMTPGLDAFEKFNGNVWKAKVNAKWPGFPESSVYWAVMDWNHRSCRQAIGYKGIDNSGTTGKINELTDTTKDFKQYKQQYGTGPTDFNESYIFNITDGSWGIVTEIKTMFKQNDTLVFEGLTGGVRNTFNSGDSYAVYQLDQDGRFVNIGDTFYIVSTKGEPRSRNLIANRGDWDNAYVPIYLESNLNHFYGLTIVGAPSIGIMTVGFGGQKTIYEKCRFLFTGKHGTSVFGNNIKSVDWKKNFFYANVMMNWPRGNTWGGNGGWPNNIGGGGSPETVATITGNIILNGGGEGLNSAAIIEDNIVSDNYSMNIYAGDGPVVASGYSIQNNDVIYTGYRPEDALERFYLDASYNGWQRNYVKQHPNGITIASERSGGGGSPQGFRIRNNNVIGCWSGISGYFEVPTAGFQNSIIENNTIILMTTQDSPPALYTDSAGMQLRARNGVDFNTIVRNNRIIGGDNSDGHHQLVLVYGNDFSSSIDVDKNIYYFPGNDRFMTDLGQLNFSEWKTLTGWDKNSVLAQTDGLSGDDWTDSSKIFKSDLLPEGGEPQPDPEPDPEPQPDPEPEPDPGECPICEVCQPPVVCPEPVVCPPVIVCPEPEPMTCNYEINVEPIKFTIKNR